MADINTTALSGRLTKDPELRETTSGKQVCSFTVACNRIKRRDQEEADADFIQCVAWDQTADYLSRYGHKGDRVLLSGRIQTRHYDGTDGRTVWVTEVVAGQVNLIPKNADQEQGKPRYDSGPRYGSSIKLKEIDTSAENIPELAGEDLPF